MNGPYETERQARAAAHAAVPPLPGHSILAAGQNHELLCRSLEAAGVALGAYDHRIVSWLAGWEDAICAVVAGLIGRAHAATALDDDDQAVILAALADAAEAIRERADYCPACQERLTGRCAGHADQLRRAAAYDALAGRLGGNGGAS